MTRLYIIHVERVLDYEAGDCEIINKTFKKLSNAVDSLTELKRRYRASGGWDQVIFTIYEINPRTSEVAEAESQTIFPQQQ